MARQTQADINQKIEELVRANWEEGRLLTLEESQFLQKYEGIGGKASKGANGSGTLHDYFTPHYICDYMWKLAYKHGFDGGTVLEPSCGTGRFIQFAPDKKKVVGFEPNKLTARIAYLSNFGNHVHQAPTIHNQYFETAFLEPPRFTTREPRGGTWLKEYPFSLVIGNPPYGIYKNRYSSYFKKPKFERTEIFFIYYGLQLLKKGGLLVYITANSFLNTGIAYNRVKQEIGKIGELVDAYRLPPVFKSTNIATDIIVLRRK